MASSPTSWVANGSQTDFQEPFPGAVRAVNVNGSPVSFSVVNANTIRLASAPAAGAVVSIVPAADYGDGSGATAAVPAGSTNGTPIGAPPSGSQGVRIYIPSGASVSYSVATVQPVSAPAANTVTGANGFYVDEPLSNSENVYITAITGTPLFRWLLRYPGP